MFKSVNDKLPYFSIFYFITLVYYYFDNWKILKTFLYIYYEKRDYISINYTAELKILFNDYFIL